MTMGYGCNAAGVVATRIIDSRRERLIAIITNNFSICNGRWPTLILMGTIFVGAVVPARARGARRGAARRRRRRPRHRRHARRVVDAVAHAAARRELGVLSLELPPVPAAAALAHALDHVVDRTLNVLWRARVLAVPAGAVIWLIGNIHLGDASLAAHLVTALEPLGWVLGLNGVILLAYLVAIPANEIIIPTILMLTLTLGAHAVGAGAGRDARARRRRRRRSVLVTPAAGRCSPP